LVRKFKLTIWLFWAVNFKRKVGKSLHHKKTCVLQKACLNLQHRQNKKITVRFFFMMKIITIILAGFTFFATYFVSMGAVFMGAAMSGPISIDVPNRLFAYLLMSLPFTMFLGSVVAFVYIGKANYIAARWALFVPLAHFILGVVMGLMAMIIFPEKQISFYSMKEALKKPLEVIELNLSTQNLTALPKEIVELKNLTSLNLGGNKFATLPKEIVELKNLTGLILSGNQLTDLPKEIVELKNLTGLYLDGNKFTTLPQEIGKLKQLNILDINGNQLTDLPQEIGKLKQLNILNISRNQLTALPKEITELKNLTDLSLERNKLTTLPQEIGELKKLTTLHIGGNQISKEELEKIKKLLPDCNIISTEK
jgi:Leucine rich repeat